MTRELRADMTTSHIPIVLLTAKSSIESKLEGLEYGADDYITKPFSATYLKARVKNLLAQRQKLQALYRQDLMPAGVAAPVPASGEQNDENITDVPEADKAPVMSPNDRKFMDKLVELMEKNMDNGDLVVDDFVRELAVSRSVFLQEAENPDGFGAYRVHQGNAHQPCSPADRNRRVFHDANILYGRYQRPALFQ